MIIKNKEGELIFMELDSWWTLVHNGKIFSDFFDVI